MILAISRLEAPNARRVRMSRSRDTEGSPASILATLDWLDFTRLARSPWVSRRRVRHSRSFDARLILSSTYAASSGERLRNSTVLPTLQPLASRRFLFDSRIVVAPETLPARLDHRLWSPGSPTVGIGLEWGIPSSSACCNLRRRNPASSLAVGDNGGVLTSPWSQISGLPVAFIHSEYMSSSTYRQVVLSANALTTACRRRWAAHSRRTQTFHARPPHLMRGVRHTLTWWIPDSSCRHSPLMVRLNVC